MLVPIRSGRPSIKQFLQAHVSVRSTVLKSEMHGYTPEVGVLEEELDFLLARGVLYTNPCCSFRDAKYEFRFGVLDLSFFFNPNLNQEGFVRARPKLQ